MAGAAGVIWLTFRGTTETTGKMGERPLISYEVTATVREDLRARYEVYMRERHIPDLLLTGLFLGAQFLRGDDGRYRFRYELADRESLERYLTMHAPRLRADVTAHFPDGISFERDTWSGVMAWPH